MNEGEALELAKGKFNDSSNLGQGCFVANMVKVGDNLRWPLTKDEPAVKLDFLNYLFLYQ